MTAFGENPARPGALISIVTVCRNAAATLRACIESVRAQNYAAIEYIVVDGASTDGSAEILARHQDRIDVLISEPDRGIFDAMNKGLARATGEFILFLNADDVLVGPDTLRKVMAEISAAPGADVYYGSILIRMPGATIRYDPPPPEKAAEEFVTGCLPHQATLARRAVFARTGPFDLRWKRHADYDWWLKVLADGSIRLRRIPTVITSYAHGGASSDLAKGQPEVYAIQNAAALYRSDAWDKRRIEILQEALLRSRLEAAKLRERLEAAQRGDPRALRRQRGVRDWLVTYLPDPAVRTIRATKHLGGRLLGRKA